MSSIDRNWADEEWRHDCAATDDRPHAARRLGLSQEQYDEARQERHVYDRATGMWS